MDDSKITISYIVILLPFSVIVKLFIDNIMQYHNLSIT